MKVLLSNDQYIGRCEEKVNYVKAIKA